MKWVKRGLVYVPSGDLWWAKSHAYIPTAEVREEYIRIYFASLDESRFGRIGYVDLNVNEPKEILYLTKEPVLDIGEPGTFDDSGVSPSCLLNLDKKKFLFYFGWQRTERVPYMLFCGLGMSNDGGRTFYRFSKVPILDRTPDEPFFRSATTILQDNGIFKMWYVSALQWINDDNELYPAYIIRYADSKDGIQWISQNVICIDFESEDEFGFGRPWVIKDSGIYKMWYSIRSRTQPYRIGYAESKDGLNWTREDNEVGITVSETGWDSEMICFPCVVDVKGKRYMFYNGNRHGETGFGYAELISD